MGETLALMSALYFGATHFLNGLLARRVDSAAVALIGQMGGTALVLAVAPFVAAPHIGAGALGWGALSGVGTGLGVAFLYRGMSGGRFSVVVPLSDVAAVALPVLVGVALLGDRPGLPAWCGIAVAPPALWLISRSGRADTHGETATASGAGDGFLAGVGFALQFVALSQADPAAGLWPLVASRAASVLALLPLAVHRPGRLRMPRGPAWGCLGAGALGTVAITLYTLATREQLLSLAVVLTALYPAIPVLLGVTVLRERLTRAQALGLVCAGAAVALLSLA
ncbi:EamA family transporter [Streptomyces iconiensis]|uniref:EamA family transporter n=1 Tax=Streptomyces iconiensis TaxID=1384038 RepID=A0ABT6ZU79_9ACTN|nr:EamA family transporter [Streptomyces iconiensis]MDJ1132191.1 EamA family transporter [Streptomyces iconiensis]